MLLNVAFSSKTDLLQPHYCSNLLYYVRILYIAQIWNKVWEPCNIINNVTTLLLITENLLIKSSKSLGQPVACLAWQTAQFKSWIWRWERCQNVCECMPQIPRWEGIVMRPFPLWSVLSHRCALALSLSLSYMYVYECVCIYGEWTYPRAKINFKSYKRFLIIRK